MGFDMKDSHLDELGTYFETVSLSGERRNQERVLIMKLLTDNEKAVYDLVTSSNIPVFISAKVLAQKLNERGITISHFTVSRILKKLEYMKYIYVFDTKGFGYLYSMSPIEYSDGMPVRIYV